MQTRAAGPCSSCTSRRSAGPLCVTRCDAARSDGPPSTPPLPLPLQGLLTPKALQHPHPPSSPTHCWGSLGSPPRARTYMCTRVLSIHPCAHACAAHRFWPAVVLCWQALSCPQVSPHPEVTRRAVAPHCGTKPSHCAPPRPFIPTALCWAPLCSVVPHSALLCPPGSCCAPLCNAGPHCSPSCPTVSHDVLLCSVVPSYIPLCSAVPYSLAAPRHAPLHPAVPHCVLSCPPVPLSGPTVHNPTPLCPTVPHAPPTHGALSPLRPPHSSHSPAAILPPRSGGTGPGWQWVVPSIPLTPPPRRGPPPCHPAVTVTQALAVLPEKMEAAALLRLWALAGEWQPQHQRGDTAGGTPIWRGGGGTLRGGGCQWESWVNPSSPWGWGFGDKGTEGTEGIPVFGGSRVRGRGCPYPCPRPHSCPLPQHLLNIAGTVGTRVLGAAKCAVGLLEMGKLRQGGAVPLLWLQPCS